MPPGRKKNPYKTTSLNLRLRADLVEELKTHCENSGQSQTFAVEKAIERYLNETSDKYVSIIKRMVSHADTGKDLSYIHPIIDDARETLNLDQQ